MTDQEERVTETFTCARCRGTFEKGWSDEASAAEADALWGEVVDPALVCDDCWQIIRPDQQPTNPDLRAAWERARRDWARRTGRPAPPFKTSDQVIAEAVDAVLRRADGRDGDE